MGLIINLDEFIIFLLILSVVFFISYIFVVLKEKQYLRNNKIILDKQFKDLDLDSLEKIENKLGWQAFKLDKKYLHAGDEIVLILKNRHIRVKGILLGLKIDKENLYIVSDKDIKEIAIDKIVKIRIKSKYGRFLNIV